MSQNQRQLLVKAFKENRSLTEFDDIANLMEENNYRISFTSNSKNPPAYINFQFNPLANQIEGMRLIMNFHYKHPLIKTFLDHEATHIKQLHKLQQIGPEAIYKTIKGRLAYSLLQETHAFSNQPEFAIKRYIQRIDMGQTRNTPEEKILIDISNKLTPDGAITNIYLSSFKEHLPITSRNLDPTKTIKRFYTDASTQEIEQAYQTSRQNVFKQLLTGNISDMFVNWYIDYNLKGIKDAGKFIKEKEMSLETAITTLCTDNHPFITVEHIHNIIGADSLSGIADEMVARSNRKTEFQKRIAALEAR